MASGALFGSRKVEEHLLAADLAEIFVTSAALHQLMRAFQRERGLLMIEQGQFPLGTVVTLLTTRIGAVARELAGVHVFMTALAILRRSLE